MLVGVDTSWKEAPCYTVRESVLFEGAREGGGGEGCGGGGERGCCV